MSSLSHHPLDRVLHDDFVVLVDHRVANNKRLLLLALLSAFPPLSTDMYLPAIPLLQKAWQQPLATVNLTLVGFFASYCVFLLFYGPLSDRFGRRPPLLVGIFIFVVASLLCAISDNVVSLILFRVLQAAGAASASTLALAICKDVYGVQERERILAYIGVIMALAPMLAPVLGGWVMTWFSWRWVFVIFIYFMLGAFSMWMISLNWADKIRLIGVLGTACGGIILCLWLLLPHVTREGKTG